MLKKVIWTAVAALFLFWQFNVGTAVALELDEAARTVKLNAQGDTVVMSLEQVKEGKRLFGQSCSYCHNSGRTKTNPNVTLSAKDLEGAEPTRDNIAGIVDYLKDPTTYDGEEYIYELHPNTTRADLYPPMRNLTDDDLTAIAGHILIQPNVSGVAWGGGKVIN